MSTCGTPRLDEIGYWSEVKLDILRDYAKAYSINLTAQQHPRFYHVYIDGFAGAGVHRSKTRGDEIPGSPLNALNTDPPFREYHFIDLDGDRVENIRRLADGRPGVNLYQGDCNRVLLEQVFPKVRFEDYRRGLCLLDPYGLQLDWEVLRTAGQMKSLDIFLNFPTMDMNRNVLWHDRDEVGAGNIARMDAFWGDGSWRKAAYVQQGLFDFEEKATNWEVALAFRQRLEDDAGFKYVPEPVPMRNKSGAVVYYLFFASRKPVAANIVTHIFNKYRKRWNR